MSELLYTYINRIAAFSKFDYFFRNTMGQSFTYVNGNKRSMIWNSNNLGNIFTRFGTKLSIYHPGTWVATFIVLGLLLCLIIGIYISFDDKNLLFFLVVLMMMGFCSRLIMGFSPTVWASGMRTYYILFIVVAIIVLKGINEMKKNMSLQKKELLSFSLTLLGICTLVLTVLNR